MNHDEFTKIVNEQYRRSSQVLASKASEYAKEDNIFHNFDRAAAMLGVAREQALVGMMVKHDVSVFDLVELAATDPGKLTEELIHEKFTDAINYRMLLKGMLLERVRKSPREGSVKTEDGIPWYIEEMKQRALASDAKHME